MSQERFGDQNSQEPDRIDGETWTPAKRLGYPPKNTQTFRGITFSQRFFCG
jgi:hypothetical protein